MVAVRPGPVLAIVLVSYLMIVLDISIDITASPQIRLDWGVSPTSLSWLTNAYTLAPGGLLLLGARAGDIIGRQRTFIAELALFMAASLEVGNARSAACLPAARGGPGGGRSSPPLVHAGPF